MSYFLYIDPGTGSALFSILIGAAATIFFLSRALFIKLKVVLSGGRITKTLANPYVIYNEGKQYWNVFKPVLDEFENREINLLYLSSAKDDFAFDIPYKFIKCEFIGEGNRAFARLNMLEAKFCLMTTPGLNVFQLKRSKMTKHYSHVLHAPTDATTYRLFGLDYFNSVLLTGDYQAVDLKTLEMLRNTQKKQYITVGCTYLDEYAKKIETIRSANPMEEKDHFSVLLSPSWGPSALLSRYGEKLLNPLVNTGFKIIIRPHPQSKKSESVILEKLSSLYGEKVIWDYENDNINSLAKADIMISDFSGIVYDYIFLMDKPVIYVKQGMDLRAYDADDLGEDALEKLWLFKTLRETGIELKEEQFDTIGEVIKTALKSESLKEARKKAREEAWQFPGEAGKRIADYMIKTVNEMDS